MLSIHEYRKIEIITANGSCDRYEKLNKHSISILTVSSKGSKQKQGVFQDHKFSIYIQLMCFIVLFQKQITYN